MKKQSKSIEPDIAQLIGKIQQQLVSLEGKIDTLINSRPAERPFADRSFADRPFAGKQRQDRDNRERAMYKAICADCNKECEVPFRPSQDRPVYCKECFSKRKVGSSFKPGRDNKPHERGGDRPHPFAKYQRNENRRPDDRKRPAVKKRKRRA